MDSDKKRKIMKEIILGLSVIGIIIIVGIMLIVVMFWGSGTYYNYETQADILLEPENSTIQNSQENLINLESNIENNGFTLDWTNYTDSDSNLWFHLDNASIENDCMWVRIEILNDSIHLEISYSRDYSSSRSNESFQSFFENDTQMLKPYNEIIINEIMNIYDVILISENFRLVEGAISAD